MRCPECSARKLARQPGISDVNDRKRIVFASGNAGKAREINAMLTAMFGDSVALILQADLDVEPVEESGTTFLDNALIKARHAARVTGLPALADDSGIAVDALNGAPGVYSARYAGADASDNDNVDKLLRELADVPEGQRGAKFCCVLAYVRDTDDPEPVIAEGRWEGSIAFERSGQEGFGYDPVFVDAISHLSAASLDPATKNARSHRGRALQKLSQQFAQLGI